ncbi:MAG: molybdopterin molybdotransferase [Candidatus Azotimanducaceae bacterium]|jgi:molybdopterin molybdotransferase
MPGSLIPVDDAIQQLNARARVLVATETVSLLGAIGRVLAKDMIAPNSVPSADNSAMDGYAVRAADVSIGALLTISDRIPAGTVGKPLAAGTAARIFTGAPIPPDADAIVIQEDTELKGDRVVLNTAPQKGDHVREAGQDIRAGATILTKGRRLRAQDIGLLASVGCDEISVYEKLKVGVMSTGDELVDPPAALGPGQIYNSNHYTLQALLLQLNMQPVDLGMVADTPSATVAALQKGHQTADCILSSGGVSVGEEDHVKSAVESLGQLELWRLAIKPGKPLAFGHVAETPFFGLPGNPVSSFVTFMLIARNYLLRCQGCTETQLTTVYGEADFEFRGGGRREYLRVQLHFDATGRGTVTDFRNQGSGVMSSVSWANGLAEIEIGQNVSKGDRVKVLLLS